MKVDVVVPSLLVAAAHIGNHYWTNNDNRQLAKGMLAVIREFSPWISIS